MIEQILKQFPIKIDFGGEIIIETSERKIYIETLDDDYEIATSYDVKSEDVEYLQKTLKLQQELNGLAEIDDLKLELTKWQTNKTKLMKAFGNSTVMYSTTKGANYTITYADKSIFIIYPNEGWGLIVDFLDCDYQTLTIFDETDGRFMVEITPDLKSAWLEGEYADLQKFNCGILCDLNDCVETLLENKASKNGAFDDALQTSAPYVLTDGEDLQTQLLTFIEANEQSTNDYIQISFAIPTSIKPTVKRIYLFGTNFETFGRLVQKYPNRQFIGYVD